jgi:NAD-dependent deacetylase
MDENIERLQKMIDESANIVFLGGAGVSTESGIPDFRSAGGLYNAQYPYPPETILSSDFFYAHTQAFYDFYRAKMLYLDAKPNKAHTALAALERSGKLKAVVTQNIDNLHQAAGSKNVLELHGSVYKNKCVRCGRTYGIEAVIDSGGVPKCACGGVIKPEVVLYGESLDRDTLSRAVRHIAEADMLIVGGTSLNVYPAAGLVDYYDRRHGRLVILNKSSTPYERHADLVIHDSIGEVLSQIRI